MRFRSDEVDGFRVFAVTGINTISFAVEAGEAARQGLLGFTVERFDPESHEAPRTMPGFKVFPSLIPDPRPTEEVSTRDHPVQSFVWDDFTARPGHVYEYRFRPVRGVPAMLDRAAAPVVVR